MMACLPFLWHTVIKIFDAQLHVCFVVEAHYLLFLIEEGLFLCMECFDQVF